MNFQIGQIVKDDEGRDVKIKSILEGPRGMTAYCYTVKPTSRYMGRSYYDKFTATLEELAELQK